ncbi:MAG: hypothetical protein Q8R92_11460 [Deltaproteobacteria bacterium]|nr:hypothetical protein [Deltaproteobacteria bacterium]
MERFFPFWEKAFHSSHAEEAPRPPGTPVPVAMGTVAVLVNHGIVKRRRSVSARVARSRNALETGTGDVR